jgi:hemoglobin/transferrin/lactoferrin receptor protein
MLKKLLLIISFLSSVGFAQQITIVDTKTRKGISGVDVDAKGFSGITNRKGHINISEIGVGDKIYINHLTYNPLIITKSDIDYTDTIYLYLKLTVLPEAIVNGSLREKINVKDEPHQAIEITNEEVKNEKPGTAADMLQNSGQILVQKSQGGGGSPIIRGFEANKLLLVIDGVRMNNAIYRSGHLQNSITIDPSVLDRTEVIFGPSSVLYGSDALGGVIHFHTMDPELADSTRWKYKTNASVFYNSNNNGLSTNISTSIGQKKWGLLNSISYSKFGDFEMGKTRLHGYDDWGLQKNYIGTHENQDSMFVNPNTSNQLSTAYHQTDILSKLIFKPSNKLSFALNVQYSTSSNVNRYDKLNEYKDGYLKYAEWYYGPQNRLLTSFKTNFKPEKKWLNSGTFILSYQRIDEDRISRKFKSNNREYQLEDVNVFALNLDLNKIIDNTKMLYYGIEVQHNIVGSEGYALDISSGQKTNFQTRYPDGGSDYLSSGVYVEYKQQLNVKTLFTTGVRYSYIYAQSNFLDTNFIQLPFQNITISGGAPSGNVGLIYQPDGRSILKSSLSSAYRAPNVDDYGKVFEKKGNTIVPTNGLKPEYAINAEISGERIFGRNRLTITTSLYYTYLLNAIVQVDYQLNGEDSILYSGEWTKIRTNANTDQAAIYGVSTSLKWRIKKNLFLSTTYNYSKGNDLSKDSPLAHISPQFGKLELKFINDDFNTAIYSYYNFRKQAIDYGGSSDNLDEAIESFGTPAWATLNYRFSYTGFENFTLQFSATNLLDIHYRQFSSAISAPGRSFMFGVRMGL